MEIQINYELSDWKSYQSHLERKLCKDGKVWWESMWVNIILWFIIAIVFFIYFQSNTAFSWPTAGVVAFSLITFFGIFLSNGIKLKKACQPSETGSFLSAHSFVINDQGISSSGEFYESQHKWEAIQRYEYTDDAIYLYIDSINAFIFPRQKVQEYESLLKIIEKNVTKHS
jgi:magnesium-transporting ATPase (P-type)